MNIIYENLNENYRMDSFKKSYVASKILDIIVLLNGNEIKIVRNTELK